MDVNDIAGDATNRSDINSGLNTLTVKAVGDLSQQELLSWGRNWRLSGTVGYYRSDIAAVSDDESGLLLGTGVLYKLGFVDLRGYVQWYGVFDDREAWDAGLAVQLSF